jgi:hypothetical protein
MATGVWRRGEKDEAVGLRGRRRSGHLRHVEDVAEYAGGDHVGADREHHWRRAESRRSIITASRAHRGHQWPRTG